MTLETEAPLDPHLRLRIYFSDAEMMGPGKAELVDRTEAVLTEMQALLRDISDGK